ncbi:MAG: PD-(D/E)XK nuclease family protein, partial [Candidatus Binatia bacterium]
TVKERLSPPGTTQTKQNDESMQMDWRPYAKTWQRRTKEYEAAVQKPLFMTPTLLKRREEELAEGIDRKEKGHGPSTDPLLIGELAHRFLQEWDFPANPGSLRDKLTSFLDRWLDPSSPVDRPDVQQELEEIFELFFSSQAYAELCRSQILGREVPLLIPWDGHVMEGVIDLLYEREGLLYLADYKTDRVRRNELSQVSERYHHQVRIYSEAARRTLRRDVAGFKLVFLRLGEAIQVL